jgi:hypothetical protein
MKTNKLIAYYYMNELYDTKLDTHTIQRERVHKWAELNNYIIDQVIVDTGKRDTLNEAFAIAKGINGSVVVASNCRVADTLLDYLEIVEDLNKSLVSTEMGSSTIRRSAAVHMVQSIAMSNHESYIDLCKIWL